MKPVLSLFEFTACLAPMLKRFNGKDASNSVREQVEQRIRNELVKHCVRDDANYRVVDVVVKIETVGDNCRLAVEWI